VQGMTPLTIEDLSQGLYGIELKKYGYFAQSKNVQIALPPITLCTDNAGMVGLLGYHLIIKGYQTGLEKTPLARWELSKWNKA